tara:strand:+ start:3701 stop:4471 length:771 start_codon:yes stop_codon:yes gene_type:complete
MRNAKEDIDYYNRRFKLNLSGRSTTGEYEFDFPPPNETANSNNFNQCLFKISKVFVSNQLNTAAPGVAPNTSLGGGFSDIWIGGVAVVNAQGILISTNIATTNNHHLNDLGEQSKAGYSVLMPNQCDGGSYPYPQAGVIDGYGAQAITEITRGITAAAAPNPDITLRTNTMKGMIWKYQDDRSIEDSGVICGNPFGRKLRIQTRSPHDGPVGGGGIGAGALIHLTDISAGANAVNNSIGLEIEVLMLPNPTPADRV